MTGKKKNIQIFVSWEISFSWLGKTKVIAGNLWRSCWKAGTAIFFTASLEIQLLIFLGDFELDIINNFAFSKLCLFHAPVLCPKSLWLKCNCYIIFIKSSKSTHYTSNKKFLDFRQLSKQHQQHHQIEICEASHFLHHFGNGSLQTIFFLLKQTSICVTKAARNARKFSWKK